MNPAYPMPRTGDVLSRPTPFGLINHVGVLVGFDAVLQNTPNMGEHVTTFQAFAGGYPVQVQRTNVDPSLVQLRTRKILARPQKYNLFHRNCEDTVYEVVTGVARSPQVLWGLFLAGLAFLLFLALRKR